MDIGAATGGLSNLPGDAAVTFSLSTGRKALSALAIAAVVGVALSPASAEARGRHYGYGAAALAGGLVLGAIAANSAYARDYDEPRDCWTEKRVRYGAYGERYVQRVRVCD